MKIYKNLVPNHWYGPAGVFKVKRPFESPQAVLRASYTDDDSTYHFTCEGPNTDSIKASAILPADLPFADLLDGVQYTLVAKLNAEHRMLIVSTLNSLEWIDRAIEAGAIAWIVNHNKAHTWSWQPPVLDHTNNKVRPHCLLNFGIEKKAVNHSTLPPWTRLKNPDAPRRQIKEYDFDAIIADLTEGKLTQREIGDKHGVSRVTVMSIAHRNGFKKTYKEK